MYFDKQPYKGSRAVAAKDERKWETCHMCTVVSVQLNEKVLEIHNGHCYTGILTHPLPGTSYLCVPYSITNFNMYLNEARQ